MVFEQQGGQVALELDDALELPQEPGVDAG